MFESCLFRLLYSAVTGASGASVVLWTGTYGILWAGAPSEQWISGTVASRTRAPRTRVLGTKNSGCCEACV